LAPVVPGKVRLVQTITASRFLNILSLRNARYVKVFRRKQKSAGAPASDGPGKAWLPAARTISGKLEIVMQFPVSAALL
jgi:hypothetical protein